MLGWDGEEGRAEAREAQKEQKRDSGWGVGADMVRAPQGGSLPKEEGCVWKRCRKKAER